mmetsp:Transcript_31501/g.75252  ORF Transcript_31501/g.75252 Transcript_31501/m.75252 type:complete len:205 (+) Transcript_31501:785-1399(+)
MTTSAAVLVDESDREWRLPRFSCLDDLPREDRSARGSCFRAPSSRKLTEWLMTRCSAGSSAIGSTTPPFCSNASWKVTADSSRLVVALDGSERALGCCSLGWPRLKDTERDMLASPPLRSLSSRAKLTRKLLRCVDLIDGRRDLLLEDLYIRTAEISAVRGALSCSLVDSWCVLLFRILPLLERKLPSAFGAIRLDVGDWSSER